MMTKTQQTFEQFVDRNEAAASKYRKMIGREFGHNDTVRKAALALDDAARIVEDIAYWYRLRGTATIRTNGGRVVTMQEAIDDMESAYNDWRLVIKITGNVPVRGDGATWGVGSDRYAGTVIGVSASGHRVLVQADVARVVSGGEHDGSARYKYERNENGRILIFTRRKNGVYRMQGWKTTGGVSFGVRCAYRDPHI